MSEKPLFKQCPNCQQFTPEKDSVCMHCEYQFAPPEVPQKKKRRTCGIWVLGVLVVLGLVFVAAVVSFALSYVSSTSTSATRTALSARETADRRTAVAVHTDTPRPATNTPTPLAEPTAISTPTVAVPATTARPATNVPIPPLAEPTAISTSTVSRFTVTGNVVNIRQGPGTTFEIIGTVSQGMQFDIIGKNQTGDWYQFCCVNDEQGWIFGELVEIENSLVADITSVPSAATVLSTTTSVPPTATPGPRPHFTVRGDVINVRQGPGTHYRVIGQLNEGKRFIINAKNQEGDWYRFCCINGKSGWIYAPLVDVENPQLITLTSIRFSIIPTPPTAVPTLPTAVPTLPTAVPISLAYENLFRYNEYHVGKTVAFKGKVLQVIQVEETCFLGSCTTNFSVIDDATEGDVALRVAVTRSSYGFWDDAVMLFYRSPPTRILEDDIVEFVAEVKGLYTYEAIFGNPITVPLLEVVQLRLVEE